MDFVDNDGTFLNSMKAEFSAALFTFLTGHASVYLCIRHNPSQQIVWTANRDLPASTSDKFVFTPGVGAYLAHENGANVLWSTNTTGKGVTRIELLDTGNLVLLNAENKTVWQSFDHPTDTLLKDQVLRPQLGMKLVSSTSGTNLSSGPYTLSLEGGDLHLVFSGNGDLALPYWSMSQENRLVHYLAGAPMYAMLNSTGLSLVRKDAVVLSLIPLFSNATLCRATLEADGNFNLYVFSSNVWTPLFTALESGCDLPLFCGRLGLCSGDQCMCPGPLQPVNKNNITQGCQGLTMASCANTSSSSHFEKIGDNLDYFANAYVLPPMTSGLESCKGLCMRNCSCSAFFFHNKTGFCYSYSQLGTVQSTSDSKHSLYLKIIGVSEAQGKGPSGSTESSGQGWPSFVIPMIIGGSVAIIIAMIATFCYWYCKLHRLTLTTESDADEDVFLDAIPGLPTRFSFRELQLATNSFSKKLGTGGFGSVYEGLLPDRTKVAVKQLESVGQGKKEFRAEVEIISGRKNYEPSENSEKCYFPAYAFTQAEHGCLEQLVDDRLRGTVNIPQAIEAVKVALWCIQEEISMRPSMAKVVQMLEGNSRVTEPPLSSQFAIRLHARMVEAANSSQHTSSTSDVNSQGLISAVQLSAAR
ncbi:hypothetical protein GOP47_0021340 [Adiantum capillus-veneris]|uniref:Receptor-like serine/threonine-protein kinase n=1 Tax=Adiantum capillus-veneris TaxID=13818 RepID=A0A9D4U866_ADICA|nr:hypothetical protein GOP47_0021340 [Adiantum capillus-veneris]